ncbi:MAG: methionine synthase [Mariniphaga sp.]|nr:methionine synthase [Mariniphaga sp.]
MGKITDRIKQGKILISDGAWGTFLHAKGLKPGQCPELWNIEHPDEVFDIAKSYIDAGADMVETNSFGGSSFKLMHYGLAERCSELNESAAAISRKAAGNKFVLGSVGPTGKILMMGEVTPEEIYESFKEQVIALEKGGADAIIIETFTDIDEARLAIRAAKENTTREVICTMTFERTVDGEYRSMMGVSPTEMMQELVPEGVDIIGANCGNGIEGMIQIVKEIRLCNALIPVLVHANAGMPVYDDGKTVFPESPIQTASYVKGIIDAGVNIIGGCCGTTPEHILQIARVAKEL